jgi:hypothetical protein
MEWLPNLRIAGDVWLGLVVTRTLGDSLVSGARVDLLCPIRQLGPTTWQFTEPIARLERRAPPVGRPDQDAPGRAERELWRWYRKHLLGQRLGGGRHPTSELERLVLLTRVEREIETYWTRYDHPPTLEWVAQQRMAKNPDALSRALVRAGASYDALKASVAARRNYGRFMPATRAKTAPLKPHAEGSAPERDQACNTDSSSSSKRPPLSG